MTAILIIGICFFSVEKGYSQLHTETIDWINTQGEQVIMEITGNSSIHWELDEYGSFRITNYNPGSTQSESTTIVKQYTYLNLYELDVEGILLKQNSEDEKAAVLALKCKKEKGNCIKVRKYSSKTDFKTNTTSMYLFELKNPPNEEADDLKTHLSTLLNHFK